MREAGGRGPPDYVRQTVRRGSHARYRRGCGRGYDRDHAQQPLWLSRGKIHEARDHGSG